MKTDINWIAASIFYLIFVAGLVFFVIEPAISKGSYIYALKAGAFFGLITYATYDLTNLTTLKGWPIQITIVDILWGVILSASVSYIVYTVANKIGV
jgi:uncharacterized membrane protein